MFEPAPHARFADSAADPLSPQLATVVPRVHQPSSSASLPIDAALAPPLLSAPRGLIVLIAPPGGGKTTALRHLRAVLPRDAPVRFFDADQELAALVEASHNLTILAAASVDPRSRALHVLDLCPWSNDDVVEYLAKVHRDECPGVLERLMHDSGLPALHGCPQLLTLVLDRMAADPTLDDPEDALLQIIDFLLRAGPLRQQLATGYLDGTSRKASKGAPASTNVPKLSPAQFRWYRHAPVQQLLAAEWIADELMSGQRPAILMHMAARPLLPQLARAVRRRPAAIEHLSELVRSEPQDFAVPMAASLLLAADPGWRAPDCEGLYLRGAVLKDARWSNLDLRSANLASADLTRADLNGANLAGAVALGAKLPGASLHGANFSKVQCNGALFAGADLSGALAEKTDFSSADLSGADLSEADLTGSKFIESDLTRARLHQARLREAMMVRATVVDADFTGADLGFASLRNVRMSPATWTGASFRSARLLRCDLEGLILPRADFSRADLTGSILTATRIREARFTSAVLRETGLAEIDWTGSDLRGADFNAASFHLGSTRCSLLDGAADDLPACEGSRTGYYGDDYGDQDFKESEEIRKACLRQCDVRGATLADADFYLVDLRGSRYSPKQRKHLRRCGAILSPRAR